MCRLRTYVPRQHLYWTIIPRAEKKRKRNIKRKVSGEKEKKNEIMKGVV